MSLKDGFEHFGLLEPWGTHDLPKLEATQTCCDDIVGRHPWECTEVQPLSLVELRRHDARTKRLNAEAFRVEFDMQGLG